MKKVTLEPMTPAMYHEFFNEYENDPDLFFDKSKYVPYLYDYNNVERYIKRQEELGRIPFAIMWGDEIAGEILIKNIVPHKTATLSIVLKNDAFKNQGIGTDAELLAMRYVFEELDIPMFLADAVKTNTRSRHVLEKVGFVLLREDAEMAYYAAVRPEKRGFWAKLFNR